MSVHDAYQEVIEFLGSKPTPEEISGFKASEKAQLRVRFLLDANRNRRLTDAENDELDAYEWVDHFMVMLKANARRELRASHPE